MAKPSVTLSFNPAGPQYAISEQCVMPTIAATATLKDITPDPKVPVQYRWTVTLLFQGTACAHSANRTTSHAPISSVTSTNTFAIPFTQVRGGDLTVTVSVTVNGSTLTASSNGLTIVGTNPTIGSLQSTAPNNAAFRKLTRLESGLRQFLAPACPLFSQDGLGGVGLCQLTRPAPTDDQVWSWKANLAGGITLWGQKETTARGFPAQVRASTDFQNLVKAWNDQRAAAAAAVGKPAGQPPPTPPPPIPVTIPDYTADQLQRETLRGFNGWAGQLHEFRPKVDANGLLVVTLNAAGNQGTAEWEELTAAQRTAYYNQIGLAANRRGDPNYVEDVEGRQSF
jgi:hypothetical protein